MRCHEWVSYAARDAPPGLLAPCVQVRGKAMADKSRDLVGLVRDILLGARLDDQARFKQMVEETKAGLETSECRGCGATAHQRPGTGCVEGVPGAQGRLHVWCLAARQRREQWCTGPRGESVHACARICVGTCRRLLPSSAPPFCSLGHFNALLNFLPTRHLLFYTHQLIEQ